MQVKKTKIQIVSLVLAVLAPLAARAQVNYAVSGNTAYATNSPSASGSIVIESSHNGYPITVSADPEKLKRPSDNGNGSTPGSSPGPVPGE